MTRWIDFFYIFMSGGALLLSVMGLWFTAIMPGVDRWSRKFFRFYFVVHIVCSFSGLVEIALHDYPGCGVIPSLVLFLECLLPSLPFPMLTVYLLHCCMEDLRRNRLLYTVLGLWAAYLILLTAAMFTDRVMYIAADGQYCRGPWYPAVLMPIILNMLLNLAYTVRNRERLSGQAFRSFLIAILPVTAVLVIHMFADVYPFIDICQILCSLFLYGIAMSEQIERDLAHQREITRQQLEIANQRAGIMVLQMRPHFIYNTMTGIYCLCNQDPQRARQVVMDFTTYLRRNFTAMVSSEPVPFTSELEHARAYLAVEQAQYEDSLFIDYDTPYTFFRVPPLTLQPIVENAVKHAWGARR